MKRILILCIGICLHYVAGVVFGFGIEQANAQTNRFASYTETANSLNLEMIAVQGGTFMMGCTAEQGDDCVDSEKPAHQVTVSDFYIGKYEVTQAQWKAVMGVGEDDNYPKCCVSWDEVQEFILKLNAQTGKQYRLPTEAEWEFAARGGSNRMGYKYSGSNTAGSAGWYKANSDSLTHPVGLKLPNELGIHDMSGNVGEWCSDWYGLYNDAAQTNPQGPSSGSERVARGGAESTDARYIRVSYRVKINPELRGNDIGFRLACSSR